ncbi:hypothetical protein DJ017_08490 [Phenylobacterium soli]|uniref:histidine kinase n=2 Tax=Phenylobacterium soli TaxID=2170551 RepID=A0A328AJ70_9CAUL|nr:hypothetical protein DJ017_08490 [Phenylobacterium soli]
MFNAADVFAGVFELLDDDYRYLALNRNTAAFYGMAPAEMIGRTGRELQVTREQIDRRMTTLSHVWEHQKTVTLEYAFEHAGRTGWYLGTFSPLPGRLPRVGFVLVDISARKSAEIQAAEERQRLKVAMEATHLGLWEYRIAEDRVIWDRRMRDLYGVPAEGAIDFALYSSRLHPEDAEAAHAAYRAALAGHNGGAYTTVHRTREGRSLRSSGQVLFDDCGRAVRVLGTTLDITAEVQAREQERLLLAELNHRVKNNLATVQSIAVQTGRVSPDLPTFLDTFEGRLVSLARTHDVLTARAWSSAGLAEIVGRELQGFGGRVSLSGPDVALPSGAALAMGLVLHELATNAAKHGALSADGAIAVDWRVEGREVCLAWTERGGPPARQPTRTGFGTRLISKLARGDLKGRAAFDYAAEGLRFTLVFPRPDQPAAEEPVRVPAPSWP